MLKPNDFWYTRQYVLNAVQALLGNNYFDPCPIEPTFDGLSCEWGRKCYINPPLSRTARKAFINKGIEQYHHHSTSMEFLGKFLWVFNYGNNKDLWEVHKLASAVCIPEKRIKFKPGHPSLGDGERPMYDNIFILWGNPEGFAEAFKDIGKVYYQ